MASITISIELELAWGSHDFSDEYPILSHQAEKERQYFERLLDCTEKFNIPITFDIVGHLLHPFQPSDTGPHPEGWFENVPAPDEPQAPLFFAPEWADQLKDTHHEIATHTYSHILCAEASPELLRWEIDAAKKIQSSVGLPQPTSLIPPRHQRPDTSIVYDEGITAIRSVHQDWDGPDTTVETVKWLLNRTPKLSEPSVSDGVLETYCGSHPSLTAPYLRAGQLPSGKLATTVPKQIRKRLHSRYLSDCLSAVAEAPKNQNLHLWTHLSNLSNTEQWPVIKSFFQQLAAARDQGAVQIKTIEDLAKERRL